MYWLKGSFCSQESQSSQHNSKQHLWPAGPRDLANKRKAAEILWDSLSICAAELLYTSHNCCTPHWPTNSHHSNKPPVISAQKPLKTRPRLSPCEDWSDVRLKVRVGVGWGCWGGAGNTGQLLCLSPWSLAHCSLLLSRSRSLSETRIRSRRHESVQTPGNGNWGILSLKCPYTHLQCIYCQHAYIQWTLVSCYPKAQIIIIL